MTDNIQKLYEIVGIKEKRGVELTVDATSEELKFNEHHVYYGYPPFTAEKQLKLIKWLMQYKQTLLIELQYFEGDCCITHCTECEDNDTVEYVRTGRAKLLENAIADLFIDMWQDLTDDQKQEVKRILE